jgi:energy-converting hydrogenase Eha subunit B
MDAIEITAKDTASAGGGFFKQVFKLNEDSQGEVLNMMQYVAIGLIPAILVIYVIRYYVPDPDDDKGSLTIVAEIFAQTFGMLLGIYFIHRMIIYFPTYSGIKYERFHIINILLVFVMILFSIKTKLGEKAQILVERAVDMWSGNGGNKAQQGQGQGQVRVTQPITGSMASGVPMTAPPPPPQLTNNRAQMGMGMGNAMSGMVKDFNAMYSGGGPQQQQQQPQQQQQQMEFEPMAANEAGWGNSSLF